MIIFNLILLEKYAIESFALRAWLKDEVHPVFQTYIVYTVNLKVKKLRFSYLHIPSKIIYHEQKDYRFK